MSLTASHGQLPGNRSIARESYSTSKAVNGHNVSWRVTAILINASNAAAGRTMP